MKQLDDEIEKFIQGFRPDPCNFRTNKVQLVKAIRDEFNLDLRSTLLIIKRIL